MVGIVNYGTYIPKNRLKLTDIASVWKKNPSEIIGSLGIQEKAVASIDEDAVTLAIESASEALHDFPDPTAIGALFVGSESHPYAVNPTSTIVGDFLGVGNNYLAADLEFACKAGTAGVQAVAGLIAAGKISYGLAIGSDTAQSRPHDVLEYTSAASSAALLMGNTNCIAELIDYVSFSSDTPDFWRRDGIRYPTHAGRFTGEPAYFTHVMGAANLLLSRISYKPIDIDYCVFHMPNGKFPRDVARRLGFSLDQLAPSLTVDHIGNPYSASSLLGLCATLDVARPGQTIFMVSYGSGAGSDALLWKTTKHITHNSQKKQARGFLVQQQINRKNYIDYVSYLKQTHKI